MLGGVLTQTLSWRWCLYVNVLIAMPTVLVALRLLQNHPPDGRPHIDVPGALLACGGLFALVYGFSNAETHSWTTPLTIVSLAASVVLLAAFVAVESRRMDPLLPLHIVRDRARGGAYLSILLAGAGVFAVFLFLTYYMQENLGFSPVKTGLSFLPLTAVLVVTSTTVQTKVLYRTGARPLIAVGMALGVLGMLLLNPPLSGRRLHQPRAALAAHHRSRHGLHLRTGIQHRHTWHRWLRGGGGLGDGQHLPAGGWLGGNRAAEHNLRQRDSGLRIHSRWRTRTYERGINPRLHHRVRLGRGNLYPGTAARAPDSSVKAQDQLCSTNEGRRAANSNRVKSNATGDGDLGYRAVLSLRNKGAR